MKKKSVYQAKCTQVYVWYKQQVLQFFYTDELFNLQVYVCFSIFTLMNLSISTPNLLDTIQSSSISTFFYFCKFQLDPRRGTNFKIEIKTEFPCKGNTEFSIRSTFSQTYKKNISSSCLRLLHTINGNVEKS